MAQPISIEKFEEALNYLLTETFESVQGAYLDKGTSLFETLATVTAEQASRPVSARCASLAAQVAHTRYYLEVMARYIRGEEPTDVDWTTSWQLVAVTPEEWTQLNHELRDTYGQLRTLLADITDWNAGYRLGEAMSTIVHSAYHLGEIRQALCTLQS